MSDYIVKIAQEDISATFKDYQYARTMLSLSINYIEEILLQRIGLDERDKDA